MSIWYISSSCSLSEDMAERRRWRSRSSGGRFKGCVSAEYWVRCELRDQEPFLYLCSCSSRSRTDFVGERAEDFDGDFEGDFGVEEREDDVLFSLFSLLSLVSDSVFFLGEDLVKRPISVS